MMRKTEIKKTFEGFLDDFEKYQDERFEEYENAHKEYMDYKNSWEPFENKMLKDVKLDKMEKALKELRHETEFSRFYKFSQTSALELSASVANEMPDDFDTHKDVVKVKVLFKKSPKDEWFGTKEIDMDTDDEIAIIAKDYGFDPVETEPVSFRFDDKITSMEFRNGDTGIHIGRKYRSINSECDGYHSCIIVPKDKKYSKLVSEIVRHYEKEGKFQ